MKKNHHQKIQNKLPKGEEKPGNRDQMDRFTRPKIICPPHTAVTSQPREKEEENSWPVAEVNYMYKQIRDLLSCGRGQQTVSFKYETTIWKEAEQDSRHSQRANLSPIQTYK